MEHRLEAGAFEQGEALHCQAMPSSIEIRVLGSFRVTIDGEPWWTSAPGRLVADLAVGTHHVRVAAPGFLAVDLLVEIAAGVKTPASVRLVPVT